MSDSHVLCQYQQGEDRGVDLLIQLREFAPDKATADIIADQIEDEKKHARLFKERLDHLDIDCEGLKQSLVKIYDLAQTYVDKKDWVGSITIQTVIEELAMATFTDHLKEQDEDTQIVMREIIEDESRHLAFGIEEMSKFSEANQAKIHSVHEAVAKILMNVFEDETYEKAELDILLHTVTKAYKMHKGRLKKIGVKLPAFSMA